MSSATRTGSEAGRGGVEIGKCYRSINLLECCAACTTCGQGCGAAVHAAPPAPVAAVRGGPAHLAVALPVAVTNLECTQYTHNRHMKSQNSSR